MLRIFIPWKNPSNSAGFEPANLVSRGEHGTPRQTSFSNTRLYLLLYPLTFKHCLPSVSSSSDRGLFPIPGYPPTVSSVILHPSPNLCPLNHYLVSILVRDSIAKHALHMWTAYPPLLMSLIWHILPKFKLLIYHKVKFSIWGKLIIELLKLLVSESWGKKNPNYLSTAKPLLHIYC